MDKTLKIYLIAVGLVVIILGVFEINKKSPIDWRRNYEITQKSPYGLYIFNQEAEAFFNGMLQKTTEPPYEYLSKHKETNTNYLLIEKYFTREGFHKLIEAADEGNNVFIASENLPAYALDTLNLKQYFHPETLDSLKLKLNSFENKGTFSLAPPLENTLLRDTIQQNIKTLGYANIKNHSSKENHKVVLFVKIKQGKGNIFVLTQPLIFTNYHLLKREEAKLFPHLFAELQEQRTVWFQDKTVFTSSSPLRFILKNPYLKYAWRTLLATLFLFAIFNAKRRQRIVPILAPPINKSVEFVRSIGNLYLQEGTDKDMAHKKATYFLERVRNELYIPTDTLDETFIRKLSIKTHQPKELVQEAVKLIEKAIHPQAPVQQKELIKMNELLDKLYK